MFTYLYMVSNKAKAAATEEGKKLSSKVNKTIAVEVNWKFADNSAFKAFSQDDQKKYVSDFLQPNLIAMVTGAPDSVASIMSSNAGLAAAVDKVVLQYSSDAQNDVVGASFVKCALNGKQLDITVEISSMNKFMAADWGFGSKLQGLVNGSASATPAPAATPKVAGAAAPPVKLAGAAAPAPVKAAPVSGVVKMAPAAATPSASAPRLIPAQKPAEKINSASGKATFLYMTLSKAQAAIKTVEQALISSFGKTLVVELDTKFVDLPDFYGYTSQDNQKTIITDKVVPSLKAVVTDGQDSITSIAASSSKSLFASKVSKIVFKYAVGVPAGVSAAVNGTNLEISFDLELIEQPKSVSWGIAARVIDALNGVAPAAAAVVEPPLVKPISSPTASVTSSFVAPTAAPVSSTPAAASAAAGARVKRAKIGGAAGGKGKFTFLYTSLENAKKKVNTDVVPVFTQLCQQSLGRSLAFEVDWEGLINDDAFCRESQADQKAMLTTSIVDNIRAVMTSPNVIPALFKAADDEGGAFTEHLSQVKRIRWVFEPKDLILSKHGVKFAEFNICDKSPSDFEVRVNIGNLDDVIDPDNFEVVQKMYEAIDISSRRDEIEAERMRAAEEDRARRAEEARLMAEEAQRRSDADRRKKAEEEEKRARLEAEKGKEERAAVVAPLRPQIAAYEKRVMAAVGLSAFTMDIDDFFVHDKRLRFKEINYKETLLKNMAGEKSVFHFLTLAIEAVAKIPLGKAAFAQKITRVILRCIPTCPSPYPDVNLHDDTKILYMDCTFSHLFDPAKWTAPTVAFRESEIVEIFKAEILHDLGCEIEAGQWEASLRSQQVLESAVIPALRGDASKSKMQCVVQWDSLAPIYNTARTEGWLPIRLLLAHFVVPESILQKITEGCEGLNLVVKKIIMRDVKSFVIRFGTISAVDIDPTKGILEVTLNFMKLSLEVPQMRPWFIAQAHLAAIAKCTGIIVKTVAAEMAIQNAEPQLNQANEILKANGFPVVTVSWAEFADSTEFASSYSDLGAKVPYSIISGAFAGTLSTMANGFMLVAKTQLGKDFAKRVKTIRVTVDPKTAQYPRQRPLISWNDSTGEFTAKFAVGRLTVPEEYAWRPQLEKIFGILLDTIRMELASKKTAVINEMIKDFGKTIPITFDEAFTKSTQYNAMDPEDMDRIMRPFLTKLPASLFHSKEGLWKVVQLTPGQQAAHAQITSVRVTIDPARADSNSFTLTLNNGELLATCGFQFASDGCTTVEPVGYKIINDILKIRSQLEQFVVNESVSAIQQLQKDIQSAFGVSVPVTMDWKNLIENTKFAREHDFVTKMRDVVSMLQTLVHKKGSNRWNNGLTLMGSADGFTSGFKSAVKSIVFRVDYSRGADGSKHGRFPDRETQADLKDGVLMITANFSDKLHGCGAHVEHVVARDSARRYEEDWIEKVADQLQDAEERRRASEIENTIRHNESEQRRYESDTQRYQRDVADYQKKLTQKCSGCTNGYWGVHKNIKHGTCGGTGMAYGKNKPRYPTEPSPPRRSPMPTFPAITSINFKAQANRETLQQFN
eukprot:TRINITY_DN3320_c0_g1_i1.p1 TRINITY_DN3320_c0_g1~~TRINITY_DN3320_c0_g1_i1.p1  ORF type:complete len:1552 (+),score=394.74 TRINITY_DN3320_c0_g1_i1:374-5029(+)